VSQHLQLYSVQPRHKHLNLKQTAPSFFSPQNSALSNPDIAAFPEPTALRITHFTAILFCGGFIV
jgi:hypothetical protein